MQLLREGTWLLNRSLYRFTSPLCWNISQQRLGTDQYRSKYRLVKQTLTKINIPSITMLSLIHEKILIRLFVNLHDQLPNLSAPYLWRLPDLEVSLLLKPGSHPKELMMITPCREAGVSKQLCPSTKHIMFITIDLRSTSSESRTNFQYLSKTRV